MSIKENAILFDKNRKRQRGETVRNILLLASKVPDITVKEIAVTLDLQPGSVRSAIKKISGNPQGWAAKLGLEYEAMLDMLVRLHRIDSRDVLLQSSSVYEAKVTSYGDRDAHLVGAYADYRYMKKPVEWRKKAEDGEVRNHFFENFLRNKWETRDYI